MKCNLDFVHEFKGIPDMGLAEAELLECTGLQSITKVDKSAEEGSRFISFQVVKTVL